MSKLALAVFGSATKETIVQLCNNETGEHICVIPCGSIHAHESQPQVFDAVIREISSSVSRAAIRSDNASASNVADFWTSVDSISFVLPGMDCRFNTTKFKTDLMRSLRTCGITTAQSSVHLYGYASATFKSVLDSSPGLLIHMGRGCGVFGKNDEGEYRLLGGWSSSLGDDCSAYMMGQKVLKSICRFYDGITEAEEARLAKRGLDHLESNNAVDLISTLQSTRRAHGELEIFSKLSNLANVVFDEEKNGNFYAATIVRSSENYISDLAKSLIAKLSLSKLDFTVFFKGSIAESNPHISQRIFHQIFQTYPNAKPLNKDWYYGGGSRCHEVCSMPTRP